MSKVEEAEAVVDEPAVVEEQLVEGGTVDEEPIERCEFVMVKTRRVYVNGELILGSDGDSGHISVPTIEGPIARVTISLGETRPTGPFSSMKGYVSIDLPVPFDREQMGQAVVAGKKLAERSLYYLLREFPQYIPNGSGT